MGRSTSLSINPQVDHFTHKKRIRRIQTWDEQEQFGIALPAVNTSSLKITQNCLQELLCFFFASNSLPIDQKSNKSSEMSFMISYDKAHNELKQF